LIFDTFSSTLIVSVTARVISFPSITNFLSTTLEFAVVSTPSSRYVVGSYSSASYSNRIIYEPFSTLLNVYLPSISVVVSITFPFLSFK
jgi:hypothetical protein